MNPEIVVVDLRQGGGSLEQLLSLAAEGFELVSPEGYAIFRKAPPRIRSAKRVSITEPEDQSPRPAAG